LNILQFLGFGQLNSIHSSIISVDDAHNRKAGREGGGRKIKGQEEKRFDAARFSSCP